MIATLLRYPCQRRHERHPGLSDLFGPGQLLVTIRLAFLAVLAVLESRWEGAEISVQHRGGKVHSIHSTENVREVERKARKRVDPGKTASRNMDYV